MMAVSGLLTRRNRREHEAANPMRTERGTGSGGFQAPSNTARGGRNRSGTSKVERHEHSPHPALSPHRMRGEGGLRPGEGCAGKFAQAAKTFMDNSALRGGRPFFRKSARIGSPAGKR